MREEEKIVVGLIEKEECRFGTTASRRKTKNASVESGRSIKMKMTNY